MMKITIGGKIIAALSGLACVGVLMLVSSYSGKVNMGAMTMQSWFAKTSDAAPFNIGVGIADITGSAAEMNMMGYAMLGQSTNGLHFRLRSRSYMFEDIVTSRRVVFASVDIAMVQPNIKEKVIQRLVAKYGDLYNHDNVMLSATHTHSGPGAYSQLVLYCVTSLGYNKADEEVIIDGIVRSITKAHDSAVPGRLKINTGTLDDANINRSPYSYKVNPLEERAAFEFDTDHDSIMLRLEDAAGKPLGMVNWFAVHGTSMNNKNGLISGDNKGRASMLFESMMNGPDVLNGKGPFVAAFAQANEGDVSPNTAGPSCDDGSHCDDVTSLCNGDKYLCSAKGPGKTDMESADIIGTKQFNKAKELWEAPTTELAGGVDYRFKWRSMSSVQVTPEFSATGQAEKTCPAAFGFSFAGGTTDGPGPHGWIDPFKEGDLDGSPFLKLVSGWLSKPTEEQKACQAPKPILLNTGLRLFPLKGQAWTADVLPLQLFRIGNLVMVGVPGEFTTMAGRRMRATILKALKAQGAANDETVVVIAGLSNSYSHYIATYEEYQVQRYEAASTLFGPHTLAAYEQEFTEMATALATGKIVESSDTQEDFSAFTLTVIPGVVEDSTPHGKVFGDVAEDAKDSYTVGETVQVVFWGAHPRNDFKTEQTFLTVERKNAAGEWVVVADDSNWETIYRWKRSGLGASSVTITWQIPPTTPAGEYRIQHFGTHKNLLQHKTDYSGSSKSFQVVGQVVPRNV